MDGKKILMKRGEWKTEKGAKKLTTSFPCFSLLDFLSSYFVITPQPKRKKCTKHSFSRKDLSVKSNKQNTVTNNNESCELLENLQIMMVNLCFAANKNLNIRTNKSQLTKYFPKTGNGSAACSYKETNNVKS